MVASTQVLRRDSLHTIERPHRAGSATVNFPGMPPQARGRLDLGPLRLCGMERFGPDYEGFSMHDHDNVEIVTVVVRGAFSHRDSLGRVARIEEDVRGLAALERALDGASPGAVDARLRGRAEALLELPKLLRA